MTAYIKRFLIIFSLLIFVISCELKKAEQEYQKGNYIESMKIVFNYLDKNPKNLSKLKPKVKDDLTGKFTNIINHYSQMAENSGDLTKKMEGNARLFIIYSMLEGKDYSKNFAPLNDFLKQNDINRYLKNAKEANYQIFLSNIANKQYDKAIETTDYLNEMNLESFLSLMKKPNEELNPKYVQLQKEIAQYRADNYIKVAEIYEARNSLRASESLYYDAYQISSWYDSNYRNSYTKYEKVKHQADLIDARKNYSEGLKYYKNGKGTKSDFRKANEYFIAATKYIPNYENANKLIKETEKGFIKYSILSDYEGISDVISDSMKNIGIKTNINPEIIFEYTEKIDYDKSNTNSKEERLNERVEVGREASGAPIYETHYFTKRTTTVKEIVTIKYFIKVTGKYTYTKSNSVSNINTFTDVSYSGKVPEKYRDSFDNGRGKYEMTQRTRYDLTRQVQSDLKNVIRELERM